MNFLNLSETSSLTSLFLIVGKRYGLINIVNCYKDGQSIDRFLTKYIRKDIVKYRLWESNKKRGLI